MKLSSSVPKEMGKQNYGVLFPKAAHILQCLWSVCLFAIKFNSFIQRSKFRMSSDFVLIFWCHCNHWVQMFMWSCFEASCTTYWAASMSTSPARRDCFQELAEFAPPVGSLLRNQGNDWQYLRHQRCNMCAVQRNLNGTRLYGWGQS